MFEKGKEPVSLGITIDVVAIANWALKRSEGVNNLEPKKATEVDLQVDRELD